MSDNGHWAEPGRSSLPYPSRKAARQAGRLRMARGGFEPIDCYRCTVCGQWHLGHRVARKPLSRNIDTVRWLARQRAEEAAAAAEEWGRAHGLAPDDAA